MAQPGTCGGFDGSRFISHMSGRPLGLGHTPASPLGEAVMRSMTVEGHLYAAVDPHPTGSAGHLLPREKEELASARAGASATPSRQSSLNTPHAEEARHALSRPSTSSGCGHARAWMQHFYIRYHVAVTPTASSGVLPQACYARDRVRKRRRERTGDCFRFPGAKQRKPVAVPVSRTGQCDAEGGEFLRLVWRPRNPHQNSPLAANCILWYQPSA
jgi:hypothetical protein